MTGCISSYIIILCYVVQMNLQVCFELLLYATGERVVLIMASATNKIPVVIAPVVSLLSLGLSVCL